MITIINKVTFQLYKLVGKTPGRGPLMLAAEKNADNVLKLEDSTYVQRRKYMIMKSHQSR